MPFFSSSSTSVNEIVSSSSGTYTRRDAKSKSSSKSSASSTSTQSSKQSTQTTTTTTSRSKSIRRSLTEYQVPQMTPSYYQSFPNASLSQLDSSLPPPSYDELDDLPLPKSRIKVTPRSEEGRELLPGYKCSLLKEAMFDRKIEMDSPFERSGDRKWTKVYCVLNNTMLEVHRVKRTAIIAKADPLEEDPDDPTGFAPGPLIKAFTLQHAEVGAASDYKKRSYVIRVRAETHQFLLACKTVETFFGWLEALSSGIALALPLEERVIPKYQTIPRRRRRRRAQDVVQQQEDIIRRHYPQLLIEDDVQDLALQEALQESLQDNTLDPNDQPAAGSGHDGHDETVSDGEDGVRPSGIATPISNEQHPSNESLVDLSNLQIVTTEDGTLQRPEPDHNCTWFSSRPSTAVTDTNPFSMQRHLAGFAKRTTASMNEQETRKWRGGACITREQNLRFAKRCMPVLNANSSRQTNLIIDKGIRYELHPSEYKMVPDTRITLPVYKAMKTHIYSRVPCIDH